MEIRERTGWMSKRRGREKSEGMRSPLRVGAEFVRNRPTIPWDPSALIAGVLVALAILAAYANSLSAALVFDDLPSILGNPTIRRLWPLGAVLSPPAGGAAVQNRPLVNLTLALNFALGDDRAFGYHLFNLGVHVFAALTLLGIVRRTLRLPAFGGRFDGSATWYASAVAALWGLHPLNTEAVTYVIQRTESLYSMFYLLTLYCCIRGYDTTRAKGWFAAAIGSCLLGMGCKEAMVTAPVMVMLYDRVFVADSWGEVFRRRWGLYAGLAATWIALGAILVQAAGGRGGAAGFGAGMTSWEYARSQFWAVCHYLRLALWPRGLVVDYGVWIAREPGEIVPYAVGIAILATATLVAYVRWPWAGYLGTWFFVILAPSSSIVPLVTQTVAEKRMYLPMAGLAALVVFGGGAAGKCLLARLAPSWSQSRGPVTVAAVLVVGFAAVLGGLTVMRNRVYRSELTLWDDAIRKRPDNLRAYFNRARVYATLGDREKELSDYNTAIEIRPNDAGGYVNRGNAYADRGDNDRALADYSKAIEVDPEFAVAYNNRGDEWCRRGQYEQAIRDCSRAVELKPDYADAYVNRGNAYRSLGNDRQALADYSRAIEINHYLAPAYVNRAIVLWDLKDYEGARADVKMLQGLGAALPPSLLNLVRQTPAAGADP